jgi:BirA family biotin operon repressor/biotin-[acetyl-CoA-carboxylase] ligase
LENKILKLLKDNRDGYVSGQDISNKLGVSRTAIWKHINQLKEIGYEIESISKKGYKLVGSPDLLTFEEIQPYLYTKLIGRNIIHFDSIPSTNIKAKEIGDKNESNGAVIISEEQTNGRGRLGRTWVSPKYKGLWMSIILKPELSPMEAAKLTQIGAAAVVKALQELNIDALIKWPNDVVINSKKVCGILTEMSAELTKINYIVMGIGVNVNIEENAFPEELKAIASSLLIEHGEKINRQELTAKILNNFETLYLDFLNSSNIKESIDICRSYSAILNKEINIIKNQIVTPALVKDIDDEGRLLVEYLDGHTEWLISGEVSIRGKEGYI